MFEFVGLCLALGVCVIVGIDMLTFAFVSYRRDAFGNDGCADDRKFPL